MLATYRDRPLEAVGERIDSVELAWLVHELEQRYGSGLELSDEQLEQMTTVSETVDVLRAAMTVTAKGGSHR